MSRQYPIPPIVQDMIEKLRDSRLEPHVRDNVATVLNEIERAARVELDQYSKTRARENRQARDERRLVRAKTRVARASASQDKY